LADGSDFHNSFSHHPLFPHSLLIVLAAAFHLNAQFSTIPNGSLVYPAEFTTGALNSEIASGPVELIEFASNSALSLDMR
jgi:hypothetical protein